MSRVTTQQKTKQSTNKKYVDKQKGIQAEPGSQRKVKAEIEPLKKNIATFTCSCASGRIIR
jgi:hypothetical protein